MLTNYWSSTSGLCWPQLPCWSGRALIAHLLGSLFHGQGRVLHSHLDFAGKLFTCGLEMKVDFAMCISKLGRVAFVEVPLVMEGQFICSSNIGNKLTRVLFLSLNFKDNISQVFNLFLKFRIYVSKATQGPWLCASLGWPFPHPCLRLAVKLRRLGQWWSHIVPGPDWILLTFCHRVGSVGPGNTQGQWGVSNR